MNSRIITTALSVAMLVLGIAGCRSTPPVYDTPHNFNILPRADSTAMDAVLAAAVRHKCLPQVESDNKVKCTSVKGNIVVNVTISANCDKITIAMDQNERTKKKIMKTMQPDEYNEWVSRFESEIRAQLER